MATPNAQEAARRWASNLRNARKSIEAGVRAVTVSPTAQAAQKLDKYQEGIRKAIETGKTAQRMQAVTVQQWQDAAIQKGLARLDSGVEAGTPKMQSFLTEFLPYAEQVSQSVKQMPDVTEDDRDRRMLEAVRRLRQFKRSGRS